MSAQALRFNPYLQIPMDEGCLSPASAWALNLDLLTLVSEPWAPGMFELNQLVTLFHWQTQDLLPN